MGYRFILVFALALAGLSPNAVFAADKVSSLVGEELQVFPGDKFYAEENVVEKPSFVIPVNFESKMNGSMGFNFRFAIDASTLSWTRKVGEWDYFTAPADKARAWHGLLGTVLAEGDTVGIRVNGQGERQWFVDNTIHNQALGTRGTTIWKRRIDPKKDVSVQDGPLHKVLVKGSKIRGLEYLGLRDGQLRIRYVELTDRESTEEFFFPVTAEEPMLIGIMGLRAEVSGIQGSSVRIKVLRRFGDGNFASPAP